MYVSPHGVGGNELPSSLRVALEKSAESSVSLLKLLQFQTIDNRKRSTTTIASRTRGNNHAFSDLSNRSSTEIGNENPTVMALTVLSALLATVLILSILWTCCRRADRDHTPVKDEDDGSWTPIEEVVPQEEWYWPHEYPKSNEPTLAAAGHGEGRSHWRKNWNGTELYQMSLHQLNQATAVPVKTNSDIGEERPRTGLFYVAEGESSKPEVPPKSWRRSLVSCTLEPILETATLSLNSGESDLSSGLPITQTAKSVHFAESKEIIPCASGDDYFESQASSAEDRYYIYDYDVPDAGFGIHKG